MSSKSDVMEIVTYVAFALIMLTLWWLADYIKAFQPVANEVVAKNTTTDEIVTNTETNIVTETEVYKMVCTVDGEGYCKEYSVRRVNRE